MVSKATVWTEPQLKFRIGIQESIIDPKIGLLLHGPLDFNSKRRRFSIIRLGLICKETNRIINFLNKLIFSFPEQKVGDQPYKGFQTIYKASVRMPSENDVIQLTDNEISKALSGANIFQNIVELYDKKIQDFHDKMRGNYDVLIIQIPKELGNYNNPQRSQDLYSSIKASAIRRQIPTQLLTERALTTEYMCENMWNISLGIYVKAGGVPWMLKEFTDTKAFIGIAYGIKKLQSGQRVLSGLAMIFNEFGEHVSMLSITSEAFGKDFTLETDGSYHLSEEKIAILVEKLVEEYKQIIGNSPEKVVLHKTTFFNPAEKQGVKSVLTKYDCSYDLVNIIENPSYRLFTSKKRPPSRGTFLKINSNTGLIYTTGYVYSLGTYPGFGIPKPLGFHIDEGKTKLELIGKEIFALTKMDWNTTSFMVREPVTTKYASDIVNILKAGLHPDEVVKDIRYYM
jgi:hypothetical protein